MFCLYITLPPRRRATDSSWFAMRAQSRRSEKIPRACEARRRAIQNFKNLLNSVQNRLYRKECTTYLQVLPVSRSSKKNSKVSELSADFCAHFQRQRTCEFEDCGTTVARLVKFFRSSSSRKHAPRVYTYMYMKNSAKKFEEKHFFWATTYFFR